MDRSSDLGPRASCCGPGAWGLGCRFPSDDVSLRDLLAAAVDGTGAAAIAEPSEREWRIFYSSAAAREAARDALGAFCRTRAIAIEPIEVEDEDWARRSQAQLTAVRIGDLVIAPPWDVPLTGLPSASLSARGAPPPLARARRRGIVQRSPTLRLAWAALPSGGPPQRASVRVGDPGASRGPQALQRPAPSAQRLIVIEPSMGFGTGHHASTRLCLLALQEIDLRGRTVIDAGTGSGVLAIAAIKLGAARVLAIDVDPDAVQSARDNVARNASDGVGPGFSLADRIDLRVADIASLDSEPADVVLANLTGAWLQRHAGALAACAKRGGLLIVAGLEDRDAAAVAGAFAACACVERQAVDEGWTALVLRRP